jgi:MFS family permease
MIGSCFFVGAFFGSFVLPRLADVVGRKPMFQLGLVLYIVTVVGMIVSTNRIVLYFLLILGGISETGRYYVAYVYAIEILPKRL